MALVVLATALGVGHHLDHVVRGNHVGWPLTTEVTVFTYSLGFYPLVAVGLYLTLTSRLDSGYWLVLAGGGAAMIAVVHFGPWAVEPPADVLGPHESAVVGYLALALVLALVGVLVVAAIYTGNRLRVVRGRGD